MAEEGHFRVAETPRTFYKSLQVNKIVSTTDVAAFVP
jgi:hypothetical protein